MRCAGAASGEPQAQYRMAIMAQNGLGMTETADLAFRYMNAAAEAGGDLARQRLAFVYMEGECTPNDPEHRPSTGSERRRGSAWRAPRPRWR
jgi:TPR repeat protein